MDLAAPKEVSSPTNENGRQPSKPSCPSTDSNSTGRRALGENHNPALLSPENPLLHSPQRTLRSSQKWGSSSAARILGLSPAAARRSPLISPMCSRVAASQGDQRTNGDFPDACCVVLYRQMLDSVCCRRQVQDACNTCPLRHCVSCPMSQGLLPC